MRQTHQAEISDRDSFKEIPSLHILLILHRRLDEVLITNIVRETPHRLHIVDTPEMIQRSLDLQSFDLGLICDNDCERANEFVEIIKSHPKGGDLILIGINPEKDEDIQTGLFDFKTACTLHAPITTYKLSSILNYYAEKIISEN
ncbi:MAG: hypothetical protein U1E78_02575 [Gammaproteobacteria bacterium]